jgi:hypothetical protein
MGFQPLVDVSANGEIEDEWAHHVIALSIRVSVLLTEPTVSIPLFSFSLPFATTFPFALWLPLLLPRLLLPLRLLLLLLLLLFLPLLLWL